MDKVTPTTLLTRLRAFSDDMNGVEIIKATEAYGYNYATLVDILKIVEPVMKKHGIWYYHNTGYDNVHAQNTITTILYNVEDEEDAQRCVTLITQDVKLGGMNSFMIEGSAITYFRRYHLTTLLGLTTDEDTDAAGKKVSKKPGGTGRSVEAASNTPKKVDFVAIFTAQAKTKTEAQFTKTFAAYKPQMEEADVIAVQKILTDKYKK